MKKIKIVYWIATGLVAVMMLYSAFSYITNPDMKQAFQHLGFPDYFRLELAIAKMIGAVLLVVPARFLKDWVYAGFTFVFISAFIAHTASGDPVAHRISPVILLVVLLVSYLLHRRLQQEKTAAVQPQLAA